MVVGRLQGRQQRTDEFHPVRYGRGRGSHPEGFRAVCRHVHHRDGNQLVFFFFFMFVVASTCRSGHDDGIW